MKIGKTKISFDVYDKPPKKSQWGKDNAKLIIKLREAALKARNDKGIKKYYTGHVKLNLIVYAPNITNLNYIQKDDDDPEKYIGDLDSLVAGVCDYIQKGPKEENLFTAHPSFKNKPEIAPDKALIIYDDSQIVEINAKKEPESNGTIHYHVEVTFL